MQSSKETPAQQVTALDDVPDRDALHSMQWYAPTTTIETEADYLLAGSPICLKMPYFSWGLRAQERVHLSRYLQRKKWKLGISSSLVSSRNDSQEWLAYTFSGTTKVKGYPASVQGRPVLILDTPGFDDTARSDVEIVNEIIFGLTTIHQLKVKLVGVIYMQRITDTRMSGSARKSLEILDAICGERAMANVTFVTTMWNKLTPEEATLGAQRTEELRKLFLPKFIQNGSQVRRHDGTSASAEVIMNEILSKNRPVLFDLQIEMVKGDLPLEQSSVGKILQHDLLEQQRAFDVEKREIEQQLQEAQQANDRKLVEILSEDSERLERQLQQSQGLQMQLRHNAHELRARESTDIERQFEEARKLGMEPGAPTNLGLQLKLDKTIQQTGLIQQQIEDAQSREAVMRQQHSQDTTRRTRANGRRPAVLWVWMVSECQLLRRRQKNEYFIVRRKSTHTSRNVK